MMKKTLIIAEAGCNHNGNLDLACQLIDVAVEAKADIVKFQTFSVDSIVTKNAKKAEYAKKSTDINETQYEMNKKLEIDEKKHVYLIEYSKQKGIEFLSSPFDHDSINLLNELGLQRLKIPSGEITNMPYLKHIGSLGKTLIMSTGMSNFKEVDTALKILELSGTNKNDITVLHCNTEYPTPMDDVNLKAMITMRDKLKVSVGYSDHTLGIEVPIAAVTLGATVIEKHFTIDRKSTGPDHLSSLEPVELKNMVTAIRNIEKAMGDGVKKPSQSELKNILVARKSIVAKIPIIKGEKFTEENITTKRPGTGLSPMMWDNIISSIAKQDYKIDDFICL